MRQHKDDLNHREMLSTQCKLVNIYIYNTISLARARLFQFDGVQSQGREVLNGFLVWIKVFSVRVYVFRRVCKERNPTNLKLV